MERFGRRIRTATMILVAVRESEQSSNRCLRSRQGLECSLPAFYGMVAVADSLCQLCITNPADEVPVTPNGVQGLPGPLRLLPRSIDDIRC